MAAISTGNPTFKRVCYYTNWSQYRKQPARFFPFNIDPFLCTHLIFAFAKIDFKGQLAPYEWNDIQYPHLYKQFTGLKKKNPHLKTLLAVGGWTHGSRPFTDMVKTPEGRKSFIEQSVQYLRAHNFDGIDLDWEYPANRGSPADDKKKFSLLVMELRDAYEQEAVRTGKERLLVTAAVAGGEKIVKSAYEVPVINKYLDFINLMSYDLNGAWSKALGINAPLYKSNSPNAPSKSTSVDEVVQLWLDLGATRDKLVMGIPTYGRSFTLCSDKQINVGDKNCGAGRPSPFTREKGFVSYYEMSKYLQQDWTRVWLEDQMVPYAYNLRLKQWVGYDDIQSVKLKAQYIKHRQLAGAMVWAVDLDDFSNLAGRGEVYPLSKAIRDVLEDADYPAFTPPPKIATTKPKSKSTQKPEKDTYKKEEGVAKKNKSSKFNNLNTSSRILQKIPIQETSDTQKAVNPSANYKAEKNINIYSFTNCHFNKTKVAPKKKAGGVNKIGPKPSNRKSPYTPPPSYLEKQASFPGAGVNPSAPTKVSQLKWPSKKVINVFQKSTLKTELSSFEAVSSPKTTSANVKRVTKPTRPNTTDVETETTVYTSSSTASPSTTSTPFTTTSTATSSTVTSTTLLSTSNRPRTTRRPRYTFKPWSRTTRKSTTPETTTAIDPTTTVDTGMRAAMFKPRLSAPTMTPRISTSLPKFRPWTKTRTFTTTTSQKPSSTKAFFLFAHLTKPTTTPSRKQTATPTTRRSTKSSKQISRSTVSQTTKPTTMPTTKPTSRPTTKPTTKPSTRPTTTPTTKPSTRPTTTPTTKPSTRPTTKSSTRPAIKLTTRPTTKLTMRSTTSTSTSPPTTSTSTSRSTLTARRTTQRARPSTKTSRQWKLTATPSAIVKIIKEKTFPMRRTTQATKVTLPPRRTTPRFTRRHPEIKFTKRGPARNITSSTPDLRAGADEDFATSTSTHKPTAPTTTIRSRSVNLKLNDSHQDSDYRRARKSTSPNPTGPQKIFAWMTAKTTKSFTASETTTKATTRSKTTPLKTTQSTATSTTTTPTTTKTYSTSTTSTTTSSPAATTRTSTVKRTTHSLMEAGLGLDHTHPNVQFSSLTKGVRKGFVNNRRGMRFFKRPFSRVTPPRLATPPPPTDRAYVLSVPKTSDCDHQNEDIRQPDVQESLDNQNIQRPLIMNTDYIPRRPKLRKRPHHGFIVENLKNNLYRRQERNKNNHNYNYKIATKQTKPQRIYSTNVRYNVPSRNSFRQTRPQTGYNIPSRRVTQPQKIVIDYRVPRGKYDTVQQNLEIKAQEKRPVVEATEKENFNKFAIPGE
ncbi:oviduct-specific glycoprotein-like [Haliotis rubra]|uniref:oviduct-specific glycoprotein-like n=1 Tax=Haliotis rubra TaxID=36100 RepID=UPI001EE5290F|nr:oviduct-specific glycoprotein-like [Haliotis rubra]